MRKIICDVCEQDAPNPDRFGFVLKEELQSVIDDLKNKPTLSMVCNGYPSDPNYKSYACTVEICPDCYAKAIAAIVDKFKSIQKERNIS